MIKFKCKCCGKWLQLGDEWANQWAKCPYSGQMMQVPAASMSTAVAPEFAQFSNVVMGEARQDASRKSQRLVWQNRGSMAGAAVGAVLGLLFGMIVPHKGLGGTGVMLVVLGLVIGGACLGAGAGGLLGRMLVIVLKETLEWKPAGALLGTAGGALRVGVFAGLGGLVHAAIACGLILANNSNAISSAVGVLGFLAFMWLLVGVVVGAICGGVLGAMGGRDG